MFAKFIGKERVEKLMEKGAILVDMRSPVSYRNGTVEGAVNLPLKNFLNKLPVMDKKSKIILFSDDKNDSDLNSGIGYAARLGFDNLYYSEFNELK